MGWSKARVLFIALAMGELGCVASVGPSNDPDAAVLVPVKADEVTKRDAAPNECITGTECDGLCVDTDSHLEHCGACNHGCGLGETCVAGGCEACVETSTQALLQSIPADIIVAVDTSGSMREEVGFVRNSMNDFVNIITASGIDAHVVLLSVLGGSGSHGICVPAPLGSGSCHDDENLPGYRHVDRGIYEDSLPKILDLYPQWSSSLRANASRAILVVTDDKLRVLLGANEFLDRLYTLDPTFRDNPFTFNAVAIPPGRRCPGAVSEGVVYNELVNMTGGIFGDLCTQDFTPIFRQLATAVVTTSRVPCSYRLPDPPMGELLNLMDVNIDFRPVPMGALETFPYLSDTARCGLADGWFYTPPEAPSSIDFCPDTCTRVQAATDGEVTIKLGCFRKSLQ